MKDMSLLRAHAVRRLRAFAASLPAGLRVAELGGRQKCEHARLFGDQGCAYVAVGFEGDVRADLRDAPLPLPTASQDVVLVSMALMYFEEPAAVGRLLQECRRLLVPGGRLIIIEAYLYGDTRHGDLPDRVRWTADGMRALVEGAGFMPVSVERLGGFAGVLLSFARDLLPVALAPARVACTSLGLWLDAGASCVPYLARRNHRYYAGHFTVAVSP